ncbi:MAG: HAD-IIB family hydrolase [Anaerorhabdus sp.]
MIKLVVADCDGTILDDHKKIDPQLKEVIKLLKQKNIIFTLATGRNIFLMEEVVQDLDLEYPYIINNGANIYQKNKMIENYSLPKEAVQPICSILENENFPFLAYSEKELVIYSKHQLLEGFKEKLKNKLEHIEFNPSINFSVNTCLSS